MRSLFVYILASDDRQLYTGVTGDLRERLQAHRRGESSYTREHRIYKLVYYEEISPPILAIQREKQIKAWKRRKRLDLVESVNPGWRDLQLPWW
jgi:putative endonuclease